MRERKGSGLCDTGAVIGVGLFSYGCWLAWHPLGFMVGGAIWAAGAVLGTYARETAASKQRQG
ncbi:MAG TPA: hypothetical protein VFC21_05995 [Bryobacteraceae bacterium]|nr:hypothetical protein [Bryobacteraceae bacterium]